MGKWIQVLPQIAPAGPAITSLTVFNGKLYCLSYDPATNADLFEWDGISTTWIPVAYLLSSGGHLYGPTTSLAVHNGKLYGASGIGYTPASLGGCLFEWNGVNAWTQVAPQLLPEDGIDSLCSFNGHLYGGGHTWGRLYEWNGVNVWVQVAPQFPGSNDIACLRVFNSKLYGGTGNRFLLEWNGVNVWTLAATPPFFIDHFQIYDLAVISGNLYGCAQNAIYEWDGISIWNSPAGGFFDGKTYNLYTIIGYNGRLYTSGAVFPNHPPNIPRGPLIEWDLVSPLWDIAAPSYSLFIVSLAVFNGKLYGGSDVAGLLLRYIPQSPSSGAIPTKLLAAGLI